MALILCNGGGRGGQLVLGFLRHKYMFWLFKEMLKIRDVIKRFKNRKFFLTPRSIVKIADGIL